MYINFAFLPAATKLGQGNILTSVCLSTGGGVSASVHAGIPPRSRHTPPDQVPSPPGADTPQTRHTHPWTRHPPPETRHIPPPWTRHTPPPREADCSIRLTSGRYASYWNAFLFVLLQLRYLSNIFSSND